MVSVANGPEGLAGRYMRAKLQRVREDTLRRDCEKRFDRVYTMTLLHLLRTDPDGSITEMIKDATEAGRGAVAGLIDGKVPTLTDQVEPVSIEDP